MANEISQAQEARNLEKMFRRSKQKMTSRKPKELVCDGLEEHFKDNFTHRQPSVDPSSEITTLPRFIKCLAACGVATEEESLEHCKHPRAPIK